jgi:hypothetical protein
MSMKSQNSPRRVYVRNSVFHLLFAGQTFGTKETQIKTTVPVRVKGLGDGKIEVNQRVRTHRGPSKLVTETWGEVKVPCTSRS